MEFSKTHTSFSQGEYYEHIHSAIMLISPLIANLFMEEFEVKTISSTPNPCLWLRFVDENLHHPQAKHSQQLLQHINSQDPHMQFTTEDPNQEGALPFLDTLVSPGLYKTLVTTV